jgi:AcrR family transcriptional regulator
VTGATPANTAQASPRPAHSGRRPGESGARTDILAAARALFGKLGFERTTIRAVALRAGVDPALVHHYFGTKEGLFENAIELPVTPARFLPTILSGDPAGVGDRAVRAFLAVWEEADAQPVYQALIRAAVTNEQAAAAVRNYVTRQVIGPITEALHVDRPQLRATLVGSQFIGLVMARYILRLEPLAGADVETVVAAVGPTVHRYLTGDLELR